MLLQAVCKWAWLNVEYLVQIVLCMKVAIKMNHLWYGYDKSFENLAGTNVTLTQWLCKKKNCSGEKQVKDIILSGLGNTHTKF